MGFTTLVYSVGFFWCILHTCRYLTTHRRDKRPGGLLPLPSSIQSNRKSSLTTKVVLQHAFLRIETSRYNETHDYAALYLSKRIRPKLRHVLVLLYDSGTVFGILGMFSAVILLCMTATRSVSALMNSSIQMQGDSASGLSSTAVFGKRDGQSALIPPHTHASHTTNSPLHLIIPGVTVPFSHLPVLLVALFVTQVIHEAGHAITAAIESIPLLSVGASVTVVIPSAFVSLSAAAIQNLSPRARLRVISAGAFHNLMFWFLLMFVAWVGFGRVFWSLLGYEDIRHFGRVVIGTHAGSPLEHSLPTGAVITSLDDIQLTSSDASQDLWNLYLSNNHAQEVNDIGWCVATDWFLSQAEICCTEPHVGSSQICFVEAGPLSASETHRCAPALSILRPEAESVKRCALSADCGDHHLCVKPRSDERLLRIGVWIPGLQSSFERQDVPTDTSIVIWSGPREEILEEVEVGVYLPRRSWIPLWPPLYVAAFMEYLLTLTLSLYFFNLLPLPFLDGSQLLDSFLDTISSKASGYTRNNIDMRNMEVGSVDDYRIRQIPSATWKKRIDRGCQIMTGTLIAICLVSGTLQALY